MTSRMKNVLFVAILLVSTQFLIAQNTKQLTQTMRGIVTDASSGKPISDATVILDNSNISTITNDQGAFKLSNVAIGRHSVAVSFVGYETTIIKEILLISAKEVYLEIALTEKPMEMAEVVVRPKINKSESLNKMATLGARMFSVEEASRFAGGMDDPARLVSSYAGVAAPSGTNNGISIHGNAPSLLQWRIEDVEVPNPNHFSDVQGIGGGMLSSLSSNVLGNSDFFIGAFPAEYNNAVSGVFDMKMRNGNNQKHQHTFQLGLLGIDFASEGPMSKKNNSSYIINYRYSTTGLLDKLGNEVKGGVLNYQDLNFKFSFPTKKAGIFSVWGTGLIDEAVPKMEDPADREYKDEGLLSGANQKAGAAGISHRYFFANHKTSLKTTVAATHLNNGINEDFYDLNETRSPRVILKSQTTNLVLTSAINHKFGSRHTNKTGITLTNTDYDMNMDFTPIFTQPLKNVSNAQGSTNLISVYTNSAISLSNSLSIVVGVNGQFFTLNNTKTVEPRASLKWQASLKSSFAVGYGLHSRTEKTDVYFVKDANGDLPNKNLGFIKSHHILLSYNYRISDDMNFKIEPYFQPLHNVPVTADGSYSILNRNDFYITESLVNEGKGRNYGVDITFEKYMTKGLYYMVTASIFDSKYKGGDGNWYNTRYNRNYIVNTLIGKEWMIGRRDILSVNLKATIMGGQRYTPVDEAATLAHPDKEVQYDQKKMYSQQFSPMFLFNYTVSYKMNRKKTSHEFAIKGINATNQKEYIDHKYNIKTNVIESYMSANSLFNISYKIEF